MKIKNLGEKPLHVSVRVDSEKVARTLTVQPGEEIEIHGPIAIIEER